ARNPRPRAGRVYSPASNARTSTHPYGETVMKACITTTFAALALLLSAPSASAQEAERGLGIGAQAMLTSDFFGAGVAGAALTYDAGVFHVDGIFGLISTGDTGFGLGVQGWYTVHGGGIADLSVGGGLG